MPPLVTAYSPSSDSTTPPKRLIITGTGPAQLATIAKSGREIMEIFEAFDLTGTAWSAEQLAGCDAKTVARYVAVLTAVHSRVS